MSCSSVPPISRTIVAPVAAFVISQSAPSASRAWRRRSTRHAHVEQASARPRAAERERLHVLIAIARARARGDRDRRGAPATVRARALSSTVRSLQLGSSHEETGR